MAGGNVKLDFTNYKETNSDYVPPGEYDAVVDDVNHDKVSNNGKNPGALMILLSLRITGGLYDGATIIDRMTLTEKAMFRIAGFMKAIGLPIPKGKKVNLDTNKFVGKKVKVVIKEGSWNGEKRAEVGSYVIAGRDTAPDTGDDLEDIPMGENAAVSEDTPDTSQSPWQEPAAKVEESGADDADDEIDLEDL